MCFVPTCVFTIDICHLYHLAPGVFEYLMDKHAVLLNTANHSTYEEVLSLLGRIHLPVRAHLLVFFYIPLLEAWHLLTVWGLNFCVSFSVNTTLLLLAVEAAQERSQCMCTVRTGGDLFYSRDSGTHSWLLKHSHKRQFALAVNPSFPKLRPWHL